MNFFIICRRAALLVSLTSLFALAAQIRMQKHSKQKNISEDICFFNCLTMPIAHKSLPSKVQAAKGMMLPGSFSWTMNGKDVKFSEYTKGKDSVPELLGYMVPALAAKFPILLSLQRVW